MTRRVPADEARAVLAALVTEADLTEQVRAAARALGWRTYHTHDSRRSEPGFPDLALARPPRLVFCELKTDRGRVTREQAAWLDALAACQRVEAYLWRPRDAAAVIEALR